MPLSHSANPQHIREFVKLYGVHFEILRRELTVCDEVSSERCKDILDNFQKETRSLVFAVAELIRQEMIRMEWGQTSDN